MATRNSRTHAAEPGTQPSTASALAEADKFEFVRTALDDSPARFKRGDVALTGDRARLLCAELGAFWPTISPCRYFGRRLAGRLRIALLWALAPGLCSGTGSTFSDAGCADVVLTIVSSGTSVWGICIRWKAVWQNSRQ